MASYNHPFGRHLELFPSGFLQSRDVYLVHLQHGFAIKITTLGISCPLSFAPLIGSLRLG
jgi:hypothetical protein